MLIVLIAAAVALAAIVVPLYFIARRAKAGKSVKKPLYAHIISFFAVFGLFGLGVLAQGAMAADEAAEAAATVAAATDWTKAIGYLGAALAVGLSGIASGIAVSSSASAAIGALAENDSTFGKSIVFVGLAEGMAIYGLLVAIIILLF